MDKYRYDPAIQAALEASPIPFIVYQYIDRRVVTLAVSAGFCDIVGVDDRDAIRNAMDNDMYHLTHPDDRARLADAGLRFAAGETDRYDMVYRTRLREDDDYIVLHAQGAHSVTEGGRLFGERAERAKRAAARFQPDAARRQHGAREPLRSADRPAEYDLFL